jgi:hypothetical protein
VGGPGLLAPGGILINMIYQWPKSHFDPFMHLTTLEEAEVIPGKHSDTRIKPLPLANSHSHGRYMTITPERALVSVRVA